MTRIGSLIFSLLGLAAASVHADELRYKIGNTAFSEDMHRITIHTVPPTSIDILPGGKPWPLLALDESGHIYAGGEVIDAASGQRNKELRPALARYPHGVQVDVTAGGYAMRRNAAHCHFAAKDFGLGKEKSPLEFLRDGNLRIATSERAIVALVTQFSAEGKVGAYQLERIDLRSCKVASTKKLGNPDLLVELASSSGGGWWITGSIEQTLLRSPDGKRWNKVRLPKDLSSLISSYATSPSEIWLAAMLASDTDLHPYMLVHSADGGKTWVSLKKDDPLLKRVPAAWLEGQKRIAEAAAR